jgi:hypothetical protein
MVINSSMVLLTPEKHSKTVKASLTGKELLTGVNDKTKHCLTSVNDTASDFPVSMTPRKNGNNRIALQGLV